MTEEETSQEVKIYSVKEFFEDVPPGRDTHVAELSETGLYVSDNTIILPEISLHCSDSACNGIRLFKATKNYELSKGGQNFFIYYKCKNCGKTSKNYALWAYLNDDRKSGLLYKYGEVPEFGPPTPAKVVTLLGSEKDYYFKGRRSENQGLGIAAFAYYRRVVENQKNKIFDEIIRTVKKVDPSNKTLLEELEAAKKETQFTKAVESIKHAIPQALLIDGHNPLTLLHAALSDGLHARTDDECLEIATSLRVVLTDLAKRIANTLNDTAKLKTAVSRILQRNGQPKVFSKARVDSTQDASN
ncbi:TPA: hypothetical protein DEP58_02490 [Patescibacteria group bacterium]|nr:MAG: hypothetical protein UU98_C0042G0007 [Parcubacteria group bacterium GW2011_GWD2_42_14]HCC05152.1 hypothetical protein [Patescibacteria group bacterium]